MKISKLLNKYLTLVALLSIIISGTQLYSQKSITNAINYSNSTQDDLECGTQKRHEYLLKSDPTYKTKYIKYQAKMDSIMQHQSPSSLESRALYTIPIVVHVIHQGENIGVGSNISDAQINEAIQGLNERFSNTIGDGLDIGIQFCLASFDPNGNPTTGINRVNGSSVSGYISNGIEFDNNCGADEFTLKDLSRWPVLDYYNIWVVNKICGGWAGYAYYPWGGDYDGAVLAYNSFNYSASTLAHELGHGFNLAHTFDGDEDGTICPPNNDCTTDGDKVCDTPPHKKGDCGSTNPCSGGGNWDNSRLNYMSYCGTQRSRFTQGQKDRMHAALNIWPRGELLNSPAGCQSQGCDYPNSISVDFDWNGNLSPYTFSGDFGNINSFPDHLWEVFYNGISYICGDGGNNNPEIVFRVNIPYNGLDWHQNKIEFSAFSNNGIKVYIYDGINCILTEHIESDRAFQSGAILTEGNTYDIVVEGIQGADLDVTILPYDSYGFGPCFLSGTPITCYDPIFGHTALTGTNPAIVHRTKKEHTPCQAQFESHSNYFSEEQYYVFTAPTSGNYQFTLSNLSGSSYDPDLFLFTCYDTSIASINPWNLTDDINVYLGAGDEIQLVVDGWNTLHTGDFSITIFGPDCNNCLTQAEALSVPTTCGKNNGIIVVNASGGSDFNYQWSPNANTGNTNTAENLPPGNYSVTVTSPDGCTAVAYATVAGSSKLSASYTVTHESCNNCNNGQITVLPSGGNSYQYTWSPNANTGNNATAKNLTPGTYSVTVTSQSCSTNSTIQINAFDCLAFSTNINKTNEACLNKCNGTASVTVSGGSPPFSYQWSNGDSKANIENLCAGRYTVTITDHGNCSDVQSVEIAKGKQVSCAITIIGTVLTAVVVDGTEPYQFLWNTGETKPLITPTSNGKYTLIVTDALGCKDTSDLTINFEGLASNLPFSQQWLIYPNPVQDKIFIETLMPGNSTVLHILDLNGKILSANSSDKESHYSIDVSNLIPGIYILKIRNEYGAINYRFVKASY